MSNSGHRGYLWDLPRNGLGVGWLAEVVDMRVVRMSFWLPLGRGDDIWVESWSMALQLYSLHCIFQVVVVLGRGDASSDGFARVPQYNTVYSIVRHSLSATLVSSHSAVVRLFCDPVQRSPLGSLLLSLADLRRGNVVITGHYRR